MKQSRLLAFVFGTMVVLGTTLAVVTSDSKEAKETSAYAGQQTCMSSGCHADYRNAIYPGASEYKKTMHANIHNRPSPENVIIERWFREKRVLKFWDSRVQEPPGDTVYYELSKGETERDYLIQLRTTGPNADSTGWLRVAYNYGGNGWLQRFLVEVNGSYYTMPFQYVLAHYREKNSDSGAVIFLDQSKWWSVKNNIIDFHNFSSQTFLDQSWDKNCTACHVNGFDVDSTWTFVPKSGGGQDTLKQWFSYWVGKGEDSAISDQNIAIGCESCHGPGANHMADPNNKDFQKELSPKQWDPTEQSSYITDRKLDLCNQCHNRHKSTGGLHTYQYNDATEEPFIPGKDNELGDFVTDLKTGAQYWEDGVTSSAHHQTGQDYWRSKHYTGHVFKNGCYDCHTAHNDVQIEGKTLPYQLNRNWYSLKAGEGCVAFGCHNDKAATQMKDGEAFNVHAQHLNKHSQCVNCHYTKTQTITFSGHLEFSDHSDKVIRPTVTMDYKRSGFLNGMLNTCASECHRNGYGERNRPDALDQNMSIRWGGGELPAMRAPDFGTTDRLFSNWRESSDSILADSLWRGYQRLYPQYVSSVRVSNAVAGDAGYISTVLPNPASDVVRVRFNLPRAEHIRLEVYDAQGKILRVLADNRHEAGAYEDEWDGTTELNNVVPSGVYFIRLVGETFTSTKSVMFTR